MANTGLSSVNIGTMKATSLSRKELSTFTDLSFNICRHIELGLVCTNADRFSHKLTLYGERLSFCSGEVWRALDKEFFKRLHKLLVGKVAPLKPIKPREHQERAIQNAYEHFIKENNGRGKLISPCGTGKSLTGYWISENLGGTEDSCCCSEPCPYSTDPSGMDERISCTKERHTLDSSLQ